MSEQPQEAPGQPQTAPQVAPVAPPMVKPYSHVLFLADGSRVEWAADDTDPHAPVPTSLDGVPVVNVVHAY